MCAFVLAFQFSSHAPSVPENEAYNGEDDNPEMIITFQLGGDAIGNVPPPTFLLARDLILRQFSLDCCQNAFASGALPRTRNFCLHFDSVITINRYNLAPPTLPDVLVTGR